MAPVLGEEEWTQFGGSITFTTHPGGRTSVYYIAPDGTRMRSFKSCQDYMKQRSKPINSVKSPTSRPKKKAVKSTTDESVGLTEEKHDEGEGIKPQVEETIAVDQPLPRQSLIEELIMSPENRPAVQLEVEPLAAEKPPIPDPPKVEFSEAKQAKLGPVDVKSIDPDGISELRDVPKNGAGSVEVPSKEKKRQNDCTKTTVSGDSSEVGCDNVSDADFTVEKFAGGRKVEKKRKKRSVAVEGAVRSSKKPKTSSGSLDKRDDKKKNGGDSSERSRSDDDDGAKDIIRKTSSSRPKRAAAATSFKEKRVRLEEEEEDDVIECKKEVEVEDETVLLMLTRPTVEAEEPQRKVSDFFLHDGEGQFVQVTAIHTQTTYLAGVCNPEAGVPDKDRKPVRCEFLGPVTTWSIMGYEKECAEIVLSTQVADYWLDKPAQCYRKFFNPFFDKARVCREVYRALSRPDGGDPTMGLADLENRLIRLYNNIGSGGKFFSRDYLHGIGSFVAGQLMALDADAPEGSQLFSGLHVIEELRELKDTSFIPYRQSGIKIGEPGINTANGDADTTGDCDLDEDFKLAQRLQYEEDGFFDVTADIPSTRAGRRGAGRQANGPRGKVYVKINEKEIANDYPEPAYYKCDETETDEYVLYSDIHPDDFNFPHRLLEDWTLYNSESRLVSLELIPMLPCAENDLQIFGSGVISEDDGSGYCNGDSESGKSTTDEGGGGFRVFLSAVKEWKVEWGSGMIVISFRTDVSWYRLGTPSKQYLDWYTPVLKTAKIAVKVITMLKEQNRVSRLSFNDVVKRLATEDRSEPTWISSKPADVERYIIVHGNIILQQIEEFPEQLIQKSAFGTGLRTKMEQRNHEKLAISKRRLLSKKENLNPRAKLASNILKKTKPMRATTTQLVNRIWSAYFYSGEAVVEQSKDVLSDGKDVDVVAEELAEEDSDDEEVVKEVIEPPVSLSPAKRSSRLSTPAGSRSPKKALGRSSRTKVSWGDVCTRNTEGCPVYKTAVYNQLDLSAGKVVVVEGEPASRRFMIEYLYESDDEGPMIHARLLVLGEETILGDAAEERELFLSDACTDIQISRIKEIAAVEMRQRNWGYNYRKENAAKDEADRARAKERKEKGLPVEYYCRSLWSPEKGAFFSIPFGTMALGTGTCAACVAKLETENKLEAEILPEAQGFRWQGVEYRVNDFLYLDPHCLKDSKESSRLTHKGGRNKGLHAFIIGQLLAVQPQRLRAKAASSTIKVRRFYRPEDVDEMKAYRAQLHEVYYSEDTSSLELSNVRGKCEVRRSAQYLDTSKGAFDHVFFCDYVHDPKTKTVKHLPANVRLSSASQADSPSSRKAKDKGKAVVDEGNDGQSTSSTTSSLLSSLDIFAGCGGLSEGLHQSGASTTKWAIEYDQDAADAFKLNHPSAEVFCDNCNVILRAILEKGGDLDDCFSPPEANELCEKMDNEMKAKLPVPGEVDFIKGGPPCQGFSGMNRFNQSSWSKVQCEMILSYLSYADYFRPRYFLLENVRNFISFNKGQTFRLTLASLLEMGYQVRVGVLQAGNFGVSQSRKRAFIWAAGPDELLPEWPEPRHVFASSQLGINLPSGGQYCAVRDAGQGAPFRAITVRDTISELPAVENGASLLRTEYTLPPESWFQKQIRGNMDVLTDHISKEMNELNLIRCKRIPTRPGADWRDLPDEKVKLSTGQVVDLIPWCLPNTAARHNQWKGLFGRLDWDGNFPTSITDPQPMGKVGMCFHPEQHRIVTVRECARSQGFPDSYKFSGNIICKHRQIGNAVPPPLACALGYKLKEALAARAIA
ncbi:hypothetical protein R1sor_023864 [Riccia sorocarpa]|uniref:DNA (cytosine-5-)-methyltransferase n=1 Tax=Riccia sorocarpa TaxID=122646 RepID=A0ABD3GP01_9MARC